MSDDKAGVFISFKKTAEKECRRALATLRQQWPGITAGVSERETSDSVEQFCSALHSPAGDAIYLELAMRFIEGQWRCDAIMYIEQESFLDLRNWWWETVPPSEGAIETILSEFMNIILPRFLAAIATVAAREAGDPNG